ncbi:MAG: acetate--CoA ligase family protein [Thermodesulfobacteriota bacterium]
MTEHFMHGLLHPGSIAIVGASGNPMKMGTMHALSILNDGFAGTLYPIHPSLDSVLGHKAYKSPHDLPEAPDLALFVLPSDKLLPLFEDFGRVGTKYAVVITAGFKETGEQGLKLEDRLVEIARKYNMRFIGPNCMGVINHSIFLNTTVMPLTGQPGKMGIVSQSGTYVTQSLVYLARQGISFSKAVSVGNEADTNLIDVLEYLGRDEETSAISLYIETIRDIPRFRDVVSRITPNKPVLAQYVGGSAAGARAGMSHTGAMAGHDPFYDGLFKQVGVIRVYSIEDLYGFGFAVANQPRIQGKRIGIITNSGGPGSAIADTLESCNCEVPAFSQKLQEEIKPLIPQHAPCGNPVDLTFSLDSSLMTDTLPDMIMKSGEVDGIVMHGANSSAFVKALYPHLKEALQDVSLDDILKQMQRDFAESVKKPYQQGVPMTMSSFFDREDDCTKAYQDNGIPVYNSPEKAARAMATICRAAEVKGRTPDELPQLPEPAQEASDIIARAVQGKQKTLDEYSAKKLLAAYGLPVPEERLAHSEDEAIQAAVDLGFPVVLKACSSRVLHKTDRGLVYLDLHTRESVKAAYNSIQDTAGEEMPVLLAKMQSGKREFLAGSVFDVNFGHCVAFGVGGIFTEALQDITYRVAPFKQAIGREMLRDIKSGNLLRSFRGMPEVDTELLAYILHRISIIPLLHEQIAEIDINPLLISGKDPVVVDALVAFA